MRRQLNKIANNFARDEGGNTMIIFGLSIIPVVMFVGGAIDFGNAYRAQQKIQRAADAGVLAAVAMGYGANAQARQAMALSVFNANTGDLGSLNVSGTPVVSGNSVSLTATGAYSTAFLKIANIHQLQVGGASKGNVSYSTSEGTTTTNTDSAAKACLLALNPSETVQGLAASGTPAVSYANCWAHTNSANPTNAIHGNGSGTVTGAGHSAVGGATPAGMYSPIPVTGRASVPDPFATNTGGAYATTGTYTTTFTAPTYSACKTGGNVYRQGTWNLTPGKWCEGLTVQANATVNFAAGEYVIENGALDFHSGAKVTGTDVLFYLNQTNFSQNKFNTYFQIVGGGNGGKVNLKGRTSATAASGLNGFLLIVHKDAVAPNTGSRVQGGTEFLAEGMIYAPKQNIKITGGGSTAVETNGNSDYFAIVAGSFEFDGNGVFNLKKKGTTSTLVDRVPDITITTSTLTPTVVNSVSNVSLQAP